MKTQTYPNRSVPCATDKSTFVDYLQSTVNDCEEKEVTFPAKIHYKTIDTKFGVTMSLVHVERLDFNGKAVLGEDITFFQVSDGIKPYFDEHFFYLAQARQCYQINVVEAQTRYTAVLELAMARGESINSQS